jgi:hypothetical protein
MVCKCHKVWLCFCQTMPCNNPHGKQWPFEFFLMFFPLLWNPLFPAFPNISSIQRGDIQESPETRTSIRRGGGNPKTGKESPPKVIFFSFVISVFIEGAKYIAIGGLVAAHVVLTIVGVYFFDFFAKAFFGMHLWRSIHRHCSHICSDQAQNDLMSAPYGLHSNAIYTIQ